MQISNKLFNQQQLGNFGRLNKDIQQIQNKISSGKNILKASDDPLAIIQLSAVKDQQELLGKFSSNVDAAQVRLEQANSVMGEITTVLTRMSELTTMAGNGAYDAFNREAIAREMEQLTDVLLSQVNTKDTRGQSLFSGFNSNVEAFSRDFHGNVTYNGDRGVQSLQISENMTVNTSIDGGTAFMKVETPDGNRSLFDIADSAINAIRSATDVTSFASAESLASLNFTLPNQLQNWTFSLEGSAGTASITASVSDQNLQGFVDEINAASSQTGISAVLEADGTVTMTDASSGTIKMSEVSIEGYEFSSETVTSYVELKAIDGSGTTITNPVRITDTGQLIRESMTNFENAIANIGNQKAYIGAHAGKAQMQLDAIRSRELVVTSQVMNLEDADLTELVTELQSQMTIRDAAHQAFAKIGQQSLFDFLR
jgi:flagellar hook-associated protein 3 FlgL